jgi:hypothetical protein
MSHRILFYGLGPIGLRAAELAKSRNDLQIVAAVDIDPAMVGMDLGDLLGLESTMGVEVTDDAITAVAESRPDLIVHCTSSWLQKVEIELLACLEAGVSLVSSTEELLWPWLSNPEIAERLDKAALASGAAILGTGVNPGFIMDSLPLFASSVCWEVRKADCRRTLDAAQRRMPFQRKVGVGLDLEEFNAKADTGAFGHVGLRESIALLGAGLGFKLDTIEQGVEPIVAKSEVRVGDRVIPEGKVLGLRNTGTGVCRGETLVTMDFQAYFGCESPMDEVILDSSPPMHLQIPGGAHGDLATAAMLINAGVRLLETGPGLKTMLQIPLPRVGA